MARTFTVAELLNEVRLLGDYKNLTDSYSDADSYMSSGTLMTFLDKANVYAWNVYAQADENWNVARYTFPTVNGTAEYALPSDLFILRSAEASVDQAATGWVPLTRATVDDDRYIGSTTPVGGPTSYRLLSGTIELLPTPGDVRNVRLTYTPTAQVISSSLQTIDGVNGFEQVVVLKATILARIREEKPYVDLQNELGEHLVQMKEIVRRRDRGTPAHTRDRRDSWTRWPRRWGR